MSSIYKTCALSLCLLSSVSLSCSGVQAKIKAINSNANHAAPTAKIETEAKQEQTSPEREAVNEAVANKVSASQAVALTVYNQNFGLVKDTRNVDLHEGTNYVDFADVAAGIDPTSVSFVSLTNPNGVVVREQNYQFDLMDTDTILSKSVGKTIKVRQILPAGGVREIVGTLLNPPQVTVSDSNGNLSTRHQGIVIKTGSGVVLGSNGEIELEQLPQGLVSKPSLLWKLDAEKSGTNKAEISYQTQGLNWKCDYVAVINKDDTQGDLTSWVTIDNKSGGTFKNASLKLMAGDVHRVVAPQPAPMGRMYKAAFAGAAAPQFQEQSFAEYHLYALQNKTDIKNNETKQLTLFNASAVPLKKHFIFEPAKAYGNYYGQQAEKTKINVKLELANSKENNLGMPLPKGKVRVYKRDADGALQFVGEDQIDHTPKDEKVRLYLGDAFDLVGERKQMSFQQVNNKVQRSTYEISLRNHKEQAVTITCVEHAYGDWKITQNSHPFVKKDSKTFEFAIKVPANGEVNVSYELEVRY